ncbi:MAG: hypothetical protein H8E26_14340 [FCB group bacterium]|nr:hypothetical protein [FCB group bacterium]MBL7027464.1 hypothetical protein [Candidatus Neomarinimicrobiota bacterium]MBL7122077.1 hypothetical protein [Candidatus Neomarinimicrobiota bacterium]
MINRALIFLIATLSLQAMDPELPKAYRYLDIQEVFHQWRHEEPGQFIFSGGDFNGDSRYDGAQLVVKHATNQIVLLAFLRLSDGQSFRWIELTSFPMESIESIGIQVIRPMEISFNKDPNSAVKSSFYLMTDAINLFVDEGPASVFFWDAGEQAFQQVWVAK